MMAHAILQPFLWPTDPSLDPTCTNSANIGTWIQNTRSLNFVPKDFTQIDFAEDYGDVAFVQLDWPDDRDTTMYLDDSEGYIETNPHVIWEVELGSGAMTGVTSLQAAASSQQATDLQEGNTIISQNYYGTIPYNMVGVSLGNLNLNYVAWIEDGGAYAADDAEEDLQSLTVFVDWGTEYDGSKEYLSLYFPFNVGAYTTDPQSLSLSTVCETLLGYPTVSDYLASIIQGLLNDLADNPNVMFLQGAPPEDLVLYDLSSTNSITQIALLSGLPAPPSGVSALEGFYGSINQYDAGIVYGLPTRFTIPPPLTGTYTAGGNSCGAVSLRLALGIAGASTAALAPTNIYNNVMTPNGFTSLDNVSNAFDWKAARDWINGVAVRHDKGTPFPPVGLPAGAHCSLWFGLTSQQTTADWAYIDGVLQQHLHPLVLRTDLGVGSLPGGGHVILLIGAGFSAYVQQAYRRSGNYYIVIDPAGHYFVNPEGIHYGRVQYLQDQNIGIAYGGYYAIYPKEILQTRITDKTTGNPRLYFEGINLPTENLQVDVRSPVTLLVSDGMGNLTGVQTNGTAVNGVPGSAYDAEWADEEETGFSYYLTNGIQTVEVNSPEIAAYEAFVTGTNNGEFTLDWSDTGGGHDFAGAVTNTIQSGQQLAYNLGVVPPSLAISKAASGVSLSWSTNVPGFVLQKTTTSLQSGWQSIGGITNVIRNQFVVTNAALGPFGFYRLLKNFP